MRSTIPTSRVADHVTFDIRSSSGNGSYPVTVVHPGGHGSEMCRCRGYRSHGHCKHARRVDDWLIAVIPPGWLPE